MVAVKTAAVDAFLARPPDQVFCFLVYGPDGGLVSERANALAAAALDDPTDTLALIRLDGDEIASDPARLLDEAHSVGLFGGRRSLLLRLGSRQITPALERLLSGPRPDARIVVQAGDLKKAAPLRTLCERSAAAAAIPCYADNDAAIARLVDDEFASAGLRIDRDARQLLLSCLGADRLATRQEIAKLLVYADRGQAITIADVEAVTADVSALALDEVVDAAFTGDVAGLERGLSVSVSSGTPASAALGAALRHALQLQRVAILVDSGAAPSAAIERGWPGLHFRRRQAAERMAAIWRLDALSEVITRLQDAMLQSRRVSSLSELSAKRALIVVAQTAGRLGRR